MDWNTTITRLDSVLIKYDNLINEIDTKISFFNGLGSTYSVSTNAITNLNTIRTSYVNRKAEYQQLKDNVSAIIALSKADSDLLEQICMFACNNNILLNTETFMKWAQLKWNIILSLVKNKSNVTIFNDTTINDGQRRYILEEIYTLHPIDNLTFI